MAQAQREFLRVIAGEDERGSVCIRPPGFLAKFYAARFPIEFRRDEQVYPKSVRIVEINRLAVFDMVLHPGANTTGEAVIKRLIDFVEARL